MISIVTSLSRLQPENGVNLFLDEGELCPDNCNDDSCVATYIANIFEPDRVGQLDVLRGYRNGLLTNNSMNSAEVERYYTISASAMAQLKNGPERTTVEQALYDNYFRSSIGYLKADEPDKVFQLFKDCIDCLTDKYLCQ